MESEFMLLQAVETNPCHKEIQSEFGPADMSFLLFYTDDT
jgi:hypothetical protein